MTTAPERDQLSDDESLVDLRCSVIVRHNDDILVIQRGSADDSDWVLPGGRPRDGESMHSCARREAVEETGIRVTPGRCVFVGEVIDPHNHTRVVELIFLAQPDASSRHVPLVGEPGTSPQWIPVNDLRNLNLRPPIAGFIANIAPTSRAGASYLGNLWRPDRGASQSSGDPDGYEQSSGP